MRLVYLSKHIGGRNKKETRSYSSSCFPSSFSPRNAPAPKNQPATITTNYNIKAYNFPTFINPIGTSVKKQKKSLFTQPLIQLP